MLDEIIRKDLLPSIKFGKNLRMLFPFCPAFHRRDTEPDRIAWNDPRRSLYPAHAQFWPTEIPEHVLFEKKARKFAQRRRKLLLRKILSGSLLRKTVLKRRGTKIGTAPAETKYPASTCHDCTV